MKTIEITGNKVVIALDINKVNAITSGASITYINFINTDTLKMVSDGLGIIDNTSLIATTLRIDLNIYTVSIK